MGLLRRADAIVEGRQCSLCAFAHSDDDLLVGYRRAVASGIDTRDGGAAALVDDDLATAQLDQLLEGLETWCLR